MIHYLFGISEYIISVLLSSIILLFYLSPVNTLGATVRRSHCDVTICRACYYSPRPLPLPRLNRQCPQIIPLTSGSDSCADSRELQQWASCVDNAYKRRYRNVRRISTVYI